MFTHSDIAPRASKLEIVKAIKSIYKVTPIKVNVVAVPKKRVVRKNTLGVKGEVRKLTFSLKKETK
ncbi:MAG: 50S ribosomal protein L23 [Candidatus Paceibacterota bacterium]